MYTRDFFNSISLIVSTIAICFSGCGLSPEKQATNRDFMIGNFVARPDKPIIYGIRASYYLKQSTLFAFDYKEHQYIDSCELDLAPSAIHIQDNGFGYEIYTPRHDGWVYIYNANSLEKTGQFFVASEVRSVASTGDGFLYCSSKQGGINVYRRDDGSKVSANPKEAMTNSIFLFSGMRKGIAVCDDIFYSSAFLFSFDSAWVMSKTEIADSMDNGIDIETFSLAPNDSFFVTYRYRGNVYEVDSTIRFVANVPYGEGYFNSILVDASSTVIYGAMYGTNSVKRFSYPDLEFIGELATKNEIQSLILNNEEIIAISVKYDAWPYISATILTP